MTPTPANTSAVLKLPLPATLLVTQTLNNDLAAPFKLNPSKRVPISAGRDESDVDLWTKISTVTTGRIARIFEEDPRKAHI